MSGTVTWTQGTDDLPQDHMRGYDHPTGEWFDGPTLPLAAFVTSRTSGIGTHFTWFVDMSIGGTAWLWTSSAGGRRRQRSGSFVFEQPGVYEIIQLVTGPLGSGLPDSGASQTVIISDECLPPVFIELGFRADGRFGMTLEGPSGQTFAIQWSQDLVNWTNLAELTNVTGTIEYLDDTSVGLGRRYYRTQVCGAPGQ